VDARHRVRPPAVAGRFYPADPAELEAVVRGFFEVAVPPALESRPVALVAPHAGYPYSGAVAGSAYALLAPESASVGRILLIGPSHYVAFEGLALPEADAFATPLGDHPVDLDGVAALASVPSVRRWDRPHRDEHCLEVHLPFLRVALGAVPILPIVTGDATPPMVADVLELAWTEDTLVVVSSDLSHYLPYDDARAVDERTAEAVERLDVDGVRSSQACGSVALRGLMEAARRRGLKARCVDLRNSGDTAGPRSEVVGYGAFGFWPLRPSAPSA
jgi:AmmeMemoRadiSam system protein B